MPTQACLDNISKQNPPTYCGDNYCNAIQEKINAYCDHNGIRCNTAIPQVGPVGKCWCCCTCATGDTLVEVSPGNYRLIETIAAGDMVLATGAKMDKWEQCKVSELGDLPSGAPRDAFYAVRFIFSSGEERPMVVMADQLFLVPSGALKPVRDLQPGKSVVQADGGHATLASVALEPFSGGIRTVSLGAFDPSRFPDDPYRGHLINTFGLVTADLAVQTAYYAGERPGGPAGDETPTTAQTDSKPTEDDDDER